MNKNRGKWTKKDDKKLAKAWAEGHSTKTIAQLLGRSQASVSTRLTTLRKRGVEGVERRGESPGAPAGARRTGSKTVAPTGEDAESWSSKRLADFTENMSIQEWVAKGMPTKELTDDEWHELIPVKRGMLAAMSNEFKELESKVKTYGSGIRELKKRLERDTKSPNMKATNNRVRNIKVNRRVAVLKQGVDAQDEFTQQLQRENASLRKALVALNEVILVYTARGEDNA